MNSNQEFDWLKMVRVVALDLDGVVYLGNEPLFGAKEAITKIRELGLKVYFVTNNSGKSRSDIANKLVNMGITATENEVLTSGYAAGFLVRSLSQNKPVNVLALGSEGLKAEIAQFGVRVVNSGPCEFLVVGFDREFSYEKMCKGLDALLAGATFIACNRDVSFPTEGGRLMPGCGPIVAALEFAYGKKPAYEVGKPNSMLLELVADEGKFKPQEILVVGDGLESDIAMANRFGSPSVLIFSGNKPDQITNLKDLEQKTTCVVRSLAELSTLLWESSREPLLNFSRDNR